MKKNRIIILLLLSLTFAACDNMRPDISITVKSDYNQIIDAVGSTSRSLAEKLQLIEAAVASGFADGKEAQELLGQAVASLSGTLEEKLAAVEAAVKSQTTSLETKLGLIEAAVSQGFADDKAQQALLQTALESLSGSLSDQLAAVEGAVKSQTASLETKLALIETAVKKGLSDEKEAQELLQKAVETLSGTLEERLLAVQQAMANQTSSLAAKLDLIEAALKNRLADALEALSLIQEAVDSLSGTVEEKLAAIDTAVQRQTTGLEAKLGLIEAAVKNGLADGKAQQKLLQQALEALSGTAADRLAAIETAVNNQASTLSSKLGLIEAAVRTGFADSQKEEELIQAALASLAGTYEENLAAIDTALMNRTDSLTTKLDLIQAALQGNMAKANDAIRLLETALSTSLKDGVEEIVTALGHINETLYPGPESHNGVVWMIHEIGDAVSANATIDYTAILGAIQHAIYFMGHNIGGYEYVELGHYEGTGQVLKWATMNIGASRPQETGDYFAWGATDPYYSSLLPLTWKTGKEDGYTISTDKFAEKQYKEENGSYEWRYINDTYSAGQYPVLLFEHDAARQNWGASWRMPTPEELAWLANTEYFEWIPVTSYEGVSVNGTIVKSKENGNSIFLPMTGAMMGTAITGDTSARGYYWSSSVYLWGILTNKGQAIGVSIWDDGNSFSVQAMSHHRYWGFAIRPVSD